MPDPKTPTPELAPAQLTALGKALQHADQTRRLLIEVLDGYNVHEKERLERVIIRLALIVHQPANDAFKAIAQEELTTALTLYEPKYGAILRRGF